MRSVIIGFFVCGLLRTSSSATADLITLDGIGPNEVVTTHIPGQLADGLDVYCGPAMLTHEGQTNARYCVDLNHYAASAQVSAVSPLSLPNGADVAYLLETSPFKVT